MKNSTRFTLFFVVFAGGMAIVLPPRGFAGDSVQQIDEAIKKPAVTFAGGPGGSPEQVASPAPLPPTTADASPTPAPSPVLSSVTQPQPTVAPAQPAPTPASPIPFNAQNKETAKGIYALLKEIKESEFDPEKNLQCITKLQDAVSQTDFASVQIINGYIKDSLTLNTLRSKDVKTQRNDSGKVDKENGSKTGGSVGVGPLFGITVGTDFEKSNSRKSEDQNTADVSISSQNDANVLDRARQQQAVSYGLLLNEMKHLGFSRPVDIKKIYGRWKWRCDEDAATYEFDFREDGTVYVKLNADNPAKWRGHGFVNKGRGAWKLDYRALTLELNDVNLAGFWAQHQLIFFANKEIVSIDDEKMLLATDEDNELKRISDGKK